MHTAGKRNDHSVHPRALEACSDWSGKRDWSNFRLETSTPCLVAAKVQPQWPSQGSTEVTPPPSSSPTWMGNFMERSARCQGHQEMLSVLTQISSLTFLRKFWFS